MFFLFPEIGQSEDPPPNTFCSNRNYYSYGDSCYRLDPMPRSYSDAQALCAADGGDLASIYDTYYEAFVEYLLYINGVTDAWIGMNGDAVSKVPIHFDICHETIYFSQRTQVNKPASIKMLAATMTLAKSL